MHNFTQQFFFPPTALKSWSMHGGPSGISASLLESQLPVTQWPDYDHQVVIRSPHICSIEWGAFADRLLKEEPLGVTLIPGPLWVALFRPNVVSTCDVEAGPALLVERWENQSLSDSLCCLGMIF